MVGTVFVNSMANILSTMGCNASLILRPHPLVNLRDARGIYPTQQLELGTLKIDIGSIIYGQQRDIIIDYEGPGKVTIFNTN